MKRARSERASLDGNRGRGLFERAARECRDSLTLEVLFKLFDGGPATSRRDYMKDEKVEGLLCKFFVQSRILVGRHVLSQASTTHALHVRSRIGDSPCTGPADPHRPRKFWLVLMEAAGNRARRNDANF